MNLDTITAELTSARLNASQLQWPADTPPDLQAGYVAALEVRRQRIAAGEQPVGYKIGFTNRLIWPRYDVYAPIWGTVWSSTRFVVDPDSDSRAPSGELNLDGLCEPRIEPEIVFGLRKPPPVGATLEQLASCVAWVAHGFEIVHTHFAGWKFTAAQGVADGGLHGRLLISPQMPVPENIEPKELTEDLGSLRLKLYGDGVLKDEGVGANVLDGPLQAFLHFVRELESLPDAPALKAGDVITTGTLTDAYPVQKGQVWHTEISATGPVAEKLRGLRVSFK